MPTVERQRVARTERPFEGGLGFTATAKAELNAPTGAGSSDLAASHSFLDTLNNQDGD